MSNLASKNIYIESETVYDSYKHLIDLFGIENTYESKRAMIVIKNINVFASGMPTEVSEPYNDYYKVFTDIDLLLKKWETPYQNWYLSYSRRIMEDRKGVDLWEKAKNSLLFNKYTRRSIINTYREEDDINDFMPSLISVQFTIDDNKLSMISNWRSKELFIAYPINALCMITLMRKMFIEIRPFYTGLEMGNYTEFIGGLHKNVGFSMKHDYDQNLNKLDIEQVKFYWSVVDLGREGEYDEKYK